MNTQTNKKITWSILELTGLLEEEDAHVHFERTTKHLSLHPYHLINIKRGLNELLKSSLNNYDKELNGFVLTFKNLKLLSNFGELLYDSIFIHVDIEADFYLFRPTVGSSLKGIVKKKGLDHIVVLVHKIYTVSIPKPDGIEEWLGDSVEIGQEIRCCVNQVDNKSKPPFICATLNSDYLHGCKLPDSIINTYHAENVIENHNLNSAVKIENSQNEILENDTISDKEKKKHRKKHKKLYENDTFEDSNIDSIIEDHKINSIIKIDKSINEDDEINSNNRRKEHRKKDKIDICEDSKYKDSNIDSTIEDHKINSIIKIDKSINEDDEINSNNRRKEHRKKHKKSREIASEPKIENLNNGVSEDVTSDRERTKHRKKRKKFQETDTENEAASDYSESYKKKKKTSIFSDSESKTQIKIKSEKFDSDVEFKFPIKIKDEKN